MKSNKSPNIIWRIWHYYILGEYHCDTCPYGWEERNYFDGDAECGCFLKGEIADESCRYIRNPLSALKVRKRRYLLSNSWDGWEDFGMKLEMQERIAQTIISEYENESNHIWLKQFASESEIGIYPNFYEAVGEIIDEWESVMHPHEPKKETLKKCLSEIINEWLDNHIRCYFGKARQK